MHAQQTGRREPGGRRRGGGAALPRETLRRVDGSGQASLGSAAQGVVRWSVMALPAGG